MIHSRSLLSGITLALAGVNAALAQTPLNVNFTYQGRLMTNGVAGTGSYDLIFGLFGAPTGGAPIDSYPQSNHTVTDGLITADIYFTAANAFNGDQRWLEVAVRPAGLGSYTTLTPRQPLTASPYAHTAVRALGVDGVDGHSLDAIDGSPADAVLVGPSGNVGIGTTSPTFRLDVISPGNGAAQFLSGDAFGTTTAFTNTSAGGRVWSAISTGSAHPAGAGKLVFRDISAAVDRLTIDGTGKVGIATTNPGQALTVAGLVESTSGGFKFPDGSVQSTSSGWTTAGNNIFNANPGSVGIGTTAPTDPLSIKPNAAGAYISLRNDNDGERWRLKLDGDHDLLVTAGNGQNRVQFGQNDNAASPALTVFGTIRTNVLNIVGGSDIAEPFNVGAVSDRESGVGAVSDPDRPAVQPGMVVSIDPQRVGELRLSSRAYDSTVAGVISGAGGVNPGLTLTQEDSVADGKHPVALTGRVWCWCDADAAGPIQAGDLLTTSGTTGHAMKVIDRHRAAGATIGKAMSSLESGRGLVLVLVNLQ